MNASLPMDYSEKIRNHVNKKNPEGDFGIFLLDVKQEYLA